MSRTRLRLSNVLTPLLVVFINATILLYPKTALNAAREGLALWFDNVLPSLLPFAVGVNLLTGLGVVHFLGILLEPVMYPLFRVPGCGGFALVSGFMSGYPLGAKVVSELRADKSLSADEARRLSAFSNNSGPLFIIGAVGAGMFGSALAGYYIYAAHALGALAVGLIFRSFWRDPAAVRGRGDKKKLLSRAFDSMKSARARNGAFGQMLGSSVVNAMETLLMVGGYIILFCVIIRVTEELGLFTTIERLFVRLIPWLSGESLRGILTGFVEITNGIKITASAGAQKAALITAAGIISWGGLSIHAQSIGFLSKANIKTGSYLLGKTLHAAFGTAFAALLYPLYEKLRTRSIPVISMAISNSSGTVAATLGKMKSQAWYFILALIALALIAALCVLTRSITRRKH